MRKQFLAAAALTSCAPLAALAAEIGESTTVGGRVFFDVSHISLQNENAAGEECGEADDGEREVADAQHLLKDETHIDRRHENGRDRDERELRDASDFAQQCNDETADEGERVQARAPV